MDYTEPAKELGIGKIKRTVKDSVFTHLFSDKKYLLQLYRVLHPDDVETREEDLDIITIENVLINGIYNDLGFKVRDRLIILVEAQATYSENILIRTLMYYTKTLADYLDDNKIDLYSTKKTEIPMPEFYVVYIGEHKKRPETLSLSKTYFNGKEVDLDLTVHMLYGGSDDIISQYVNFTKVYDQQRKLYGKREQAIRETINICKNKHYLKEYLQSKEREVYDIMYTLFDDERITRIHEAALYNEGKADAERAFAEREAAYVEERAAYVEREASYLSEMAALKAELEKYRAAGIQV